METKIITKPGEAEIVAEMIVFARGKRSLGVGLPKSWTAKCKIRAGMRLKLTYLEQNPAQIVLESGIVKKDKSRG